MNRYAVRSITLKELWSCYGKGSSGRFECDITMADGRHVTHIYKGYGVLRLEQITKLILGKKGFQGIELACDDIYDRGRPRVFKIRD